MFNKITLPYKYLLQACFLSIILLGWTQIQAQSVTYTSIPANLTGCEPLTISLTEVATGGLPTSRMWIWGDGDTTFNTTSVAHTYNAGNLGDTTYIACLMTTFLNGTTQTHCDTVTVFKKPFVDFTADTNTVCQFATVCFNNLSSNGPGYSYSWIFGGGIAISSNVSPCISFPTPDTIDVQLTVTDNNGCVRQKIVNNYINIITSPIPQFNLTNNSLVKCNPFTSGFNNQTDTSIAITSWQWNFGDGTPNATTKNPGLHTWNLADTVSVSLEATNVLGCTNSSNIVFIINPTPVASFTATTPVCINEPSTIDFNGVTYPGATYQWEFDNGTINSGSGPGPYTIDWDTSGVQGLQLIVDISGCRDTTTRSVRVNPLPFVNLTNSTANDSICDGQTVTFTASPAPYPTYKFRKNGAIVQNSNVELYSTANINNGDDFYVTVIDANGCESLPSDTSSIGVVSVPNMSLISSAINDTVCAGDVISLNAAPNGLDRYIFYNKSLVLTDTTTDVITNVGVPSDNLFTVRGFNLTCSDLSDPLEIDVVDSLPAPNLNCGTSTNTSVRFNWTSVPGALGYEISVNGAPFMGPTNGTLALTEFFNGLTPGDSIKLRLRALGPIACGNSPITNEVTCKAIPCTVDSLVPPVSRQICEGQSTQFRIRDIQTANYGISWNGNPFGVDSNYTITPSPGFYNISVVFRDSNQVGCPSQTFSATVNVTATPIVALSVTDSICQTANLTATATPAGYDNYIFSSGFNQLQTGYQNSFVTTNWQNGNTISVRAVENGCSGPATTPVSVYVDVPMKAPNVYCGASTNTTIQFMWDPIPGATGYIISEDGVNFFTPSSGSLGLTHTFTGLIPGDSKTIFVRALNDNPCGDSPISLPATCYAIPCNPVNFDITPTQTVCEGTTVNVGISNINTQNYDAYWAFVNEGTTTSKSFVVTNDTSIVVTVVDTNQLVCPSPSKTIKVNVKPKPDVSLIAQPGSVVCFGDTLILQADPQGYDFYHFYANGSSLNYSADDQLIVTNLQTIDSVYVVATENGCTGEPSNLIDITVNFKPTTPQVYCGTTTNTSIQFLWDSLFGAANYQVSINGGSFIPANGFLSHQLNGVTPGDTATIEVFATGLTPCGNSDISITAQCIAIPCSTINFSVPPTITVCEGDSLGFAVDSITTNNFGLNFGFGFDTLTSIGFTPQNDTTIVIALKDSNQLACPGPIKTVFVDVIEIPNITLSLDSVQSVYCLGDTVSITAAPNNFGLYSFYNGNTILQSGAGNTLITTSLLNQDSVYCIANDFGCSGDLSAGITVNIEDPLDAPVVNCGNSTNTSMSFTWDPIAGATGYMISINDSNFIVPSTGLFGLSHFINGLNPNDSLTVNVMALGNGACGNSIPSADHTCYAIPCNAVSFDVSNDTIVCQGTTIQTAINSISTNNFSVTWNGVNTNSTNYNITITQDTSVSVTVKDLNQAVCPGSTKFIDVVSIPEPVINLVNVGPDTICTGNLVTLLAQPNNYDTYYFFEGYQPLQNGASNSVTLTNYNGVKPIRAYAENSGCVSAYTEYNSIVVEQPLETPQLNCGTSTNTSIEFVWTGVSGATGYEVSINDSNFVIPSTGILGLSHLISGLNPNDSIQLEVIALGDAPCGNSNISTQVTCYAIPCNPISFDLTDDTTICAGEPVTAYASNLSTINYALIQNGTQTSINPFTFYPPHDTTLVYALIDSNQVVCPPHVKVMNITVNETPNITLTTIPSNDTVCTGANVFVEAQPFSYDSYVFLQNFDTIQNGFNPSLTSNTIQNGDLITVYAFIGTCVNQNQQIVSYTVVDPLEKPVAYCGPSTNTSIQFGWDPITDATGYEVLINDTNWIAPSSGISGLTHFSGGLTPGQSLEFVVQALGDAPCGNSPISDTITCVAQPCDSLNFNISPTVNLCEGESATVGINSVSVSNWSVQVNGLVSGPTVNLTPLNDTLLAFTVSNNSQPVCPSVTKYVSINVTPIPQVSLSSNLLGNNACSNDSIVFAASDFGFDFYWFIQGFDTLQAGPQPYYSPATWIGTDSVAIVAMENGCIGNSSSSLTVSLVDPLDAPEINCGNSTFTSIDFTWDSVQGATGYLINVNNTGFAVPTNGISSLFESVSGLSPGDSLTAVVQALSGAPCFNGFISDTVTCYAIPCTAFSFTESNDTTICNGAEVALGITSIPLTNYTINWNGVATTQLLDTLQPNADTTIVISVRDLNQPGCPSINRTINVDVNPIPTATLLSNDGDNQICLGSSVAFYASIPGYDNYQFYSMPGNQLVQDSTYHVLNLDSVTSIQTIYMIATDLGCSDTSQLVTFTTLQLPNINLTNTTSSNLSCFGQPVTFTASPNDLVLYNFYIDSVLVQTDSIASLTVDTFSVGTTPPIYVTVTDTFGCRNTSTPATQIQIVPLPVLSISNSIPDTVCAQDTVEFVVSPANLSSYTVYVNSNLLFTQASNIVQLASISNGDFIQIQGTDANGCSSFANDTFNIVVNPIAAPNVTDDTVDVCLGNDAVLSVTPDPNYPNALYYWSNGDVGETINFTVNQNTTLTVYSVLGNCQSELDSVSVNIDASSPTATVTPNTTICIGDSIELVASGGLQYEWSPATYLNRIDTNTVTATPIETTTYIVRVTNLACYDEATITVTVDRCLDDLPADIPNIISPNDDGANDYLIIKDVDYFTDNTLTIFNRWGNQVYAVENYDNTWGGTNQNGDPLPDGTYYYILDLKNGKTPYVGFIMIHR